MIFIQISTTNTNIQFFFIFMLRKNRLLSDIDECKTSNKKVDDALQKTKDEITEKIDKEAKEV